MKINNEEVNIESLVTEDLHKNLHKLYKKDIYLSDKDIEILERYGYNINYYSDVKALILDISAFIDDNCDEDLEDLEEVVNSLQEFNYYHNTNK